MSDYCGQKLFQECKCILKAREILLWPYWGAENEIIVFLINEGSNRSFILANRKIIKNSMHRHFKGFQVKKSAIG